jgi:hypothetical protein
MSPPTILSLDEGGLVRDRPRVLASQKEADKDATLFIANLLSSSQVGRRKYAHASRSQGSARFLAIIPFSPLMWPASEARCGKNRSCLVASLHWE